MNDAEWKKQNNSPYCVFCGAKDHYTVDHKTATQDHQPDKMILIELSMESYNTLLYRLHAVRNDSPELAIAYAELRDAVNNQPSQIEFK